MCVGVTHTCQMREEGGWVGGRNQSHHNFLVPVLFFSEEDLVPSVQRLARTLTTSAFE